MKRALAPVVAATLAVLLTGCASLPAAPAPAAPVAVELTSPLAAPATIRFRLDRPVTALHFADDLGGYRQREWRIVAPGFHWVVEPADATLGTIQGERIERVDGAPFTEVSFTVEQRYRALPKNYAPFSPFSDGGVLIYSGFLHACTAFPCSGAGPVAMRIVAPGRQIRSGGQVAIGEARYVSADDGTNIYVGNRRPVAANGVDAIIDPALPATVGGRLSQSLPAATTYFSRSLGPLSFTPALFVSLDPRRQPDGHVSTQGGTLPGQIFMHFDGEGPADRFDADKTVWLDWFFAHEVAHLFQRDKTGNRSGDDAIAWMHEGGADAMAALALIDQQRSDYVRSRVETAASDCAAALAQGPLTTATARGSFDAHYACGLIAHLALDADLRGHGSNLAAFNAHLFAAVRGGAPWSEASWFEAARAEGASAQTLVLLTRLVGADAPAAITALGEASARARQVGNSA